MSGIYRSAQYSNILAILPNPLTRIELPDSPEREWVARTPAENPNPTGAADAPSNPPPPDADNRGH